jgi:hypothetical protein
MPMSPANVSTQGSSAPVTMAAPAAIVVSAAAVCQLRSRAACRERSAVRVVRVVMAVGPNASGAGTGAAGAVATGRRPPGHGEAMPGRALACGYRRTEKYRNRLAGVCV